jgi:hypothetical protein
MGICAYVRTLDGSAPFLLQHHVQPRHVSNLQNPVLPFTVTEKAAAPRQRGGRKETGKEAKKASEEEKRCV